MDVDLKTKLVFKFHKNWLLIPKYKGRFFLPPFCSFFAETLSFTRVLLVAESKKGRSRILEEKMTKISDYVYFIWVIFQKIQKYLLSLVLSNFVCFNEKNPIYLEFYIKSVSGPFFALKTRFLHRPFFARFSTFLGAKKFFPTLKQLST